MPGNFKASGSQVKSNRGHLEGTKVMPLSTKEFSDRTASQSEGHVLGISVGAENVIAGLLYSRIEHQLHRMTLLPQSTCKNPYLTSHRPSFLIQAVHPGSISTLSFSSHSTIFDTLPDYPSLR